MKKPVTATATTREQAEGRLLNRELSWLDYNGRVLEMAEDPGVPLLERVRSDEVLRRRTWTSSSWCASPG